MTQFIVRQLEPGVKIRLKARARRHGRSMEAEVREILRAAVAEPAEPRQKLGSRISGRFSKIGLTEALPELRGQDAQPLAFATKRGNKAQRR